MPSALPTEYQSFIHLSRYSRWLPEKGRRETWEETVYRYFDFFVDHLRENCKYNVSSTEREVLENAVLNLEVMPSMRALMTAGKALWEHPTSAYNCAFLAVDNIRAFDEAMYILMCGTGVGFSVESEHIRKLPTVAEKLETTDTTIVVADSKIGWAKSLRELISLLYSGQIPKWDVSKVRPAGARLKTMGGRASGPDPLVSLFEFIVKTFRVAVGRKLNSLECHDIVCKIAEVVVVGGVRRSATISLSDLSDERMRVAKSGAWWEQNVQRALANNSAAYYERPDISQFMSEWKALYDSKSGERGIFNMSGARKHASKNERRDGSKISGVNPCAEILLRANQFCNLSEVVVRHDDTLESLKRKVAIATTLGTWQSTLTDFKHLSKRWKDNTEEEMLLGVSLTGILDNQLTNTPSEELEKILVELKELSVATNKKIATKLGVAPSAAITTVKPSGTVSALVDSASGIHPRHSRHYIRTVRADNKDPLCKLMRESGFPFEPDCTKPDSVTVFSFPMKAPEHAVFRNDLTALQHLDLWLFYKKHWAEHTVSITVSVKEHEWIDVAAWVYRNFDDITGISFLPYSDHVYKQAPFQECDEAEYQRVLALMPKGVDWSKLSQYELEDTTTSSQNLACSGNSCEIVDLLPSDNT